MWYEIIPCFSIMVAAMSLGQLATSAVPNLFIGHPFLRQLVTPTQISNYLRDERLMDGDPYNAQGLEVIPDEDNSKKDAC